MVYKDVLNTHYGCVLNIIHLLSTIIDNNLLLVVQSSMPGKGALLIFFWRVVDTSIKSSQADLLHFFSWEHLLFKVFQA